MHEVEAAPESTIAQKVAPQSVKEEAASPVAQGLAKTRPEAALVAVAIPR